MQKYPISDDGSSHQHEREQRAEVMLATTPSTTPRQLPLPAYLNASTGTIISSVNGTLVVHVKADSYNYNSLISNVEFTTNFSSNSNNNTNTVSYEQLSREFYQSYDPSIGLHTAAVLGGILVWLVLYVIYRTKIRKCVIRLVKQKFADEEDLDQKFSDSERDSGSGVNTSMARALINPSIVIEASPPQSPFTYDQYNMAGDQECFSPYSLPGAGINGDGRVFHFPYPDHGGSQQNLSNYHQQFCHDQHDMFIQLPTSEQDIPTATARWVQNTPLEDRSRHDFAGLMLSLKNHCQQVMHKPCSCPVVYPKSPEPLPLLDIPKSWTKSLPVLSNSLSSQLLSAYEVVNYKHTTDKDIKDSINAKRKMSRHKDNRDRDYGESATLIERKEKFHSHRRQGHVSMGYHSGHIRRGKHMKLPPKLTIKIPDNKENQPIYDNPNFTRSPVPIPFTPTVMIQNSKQFQRRHLDGESNTSASSNSSTDLLLAAIKPPPIRIIKPRSQDLPSPHLLSPMYDNRRRHGSQDVFSWSRDDIKRYHEDMRNSGSVSPLHCNVDHQKCSFRYQKVDNPRDRGYHQNSNDGIFRRHGSCGDSNLTSEVRISDMPHHRRSLSDYTYHNDFLFNSSPTSPLYHHRSLSADVPFSMTLQGEEHSPPCSNESNTNLRTLSYSPTPYLLQVPDPSVIHRSMTPDCGGNNKYHAGTYNTGSQPSMRHCVHSDSNIAYYTDQFSPCDTNVDNFTIRRHSAVVPGEINLSFCGDNTIQPSPSFGSSGSYTSPHHHAQVPHRHSSHHIDHHHCHHSTGMLGLDDNSGRHIPCISHPHSYMNRSFSEVVMETKL